MKENPFQSENEYDNSLDKITERSEEDASIDNQLSEKKKFSNISH